MRLMKCNRTVSLLTLAIGLAANGYSQSWLTNGLVASYPFNGNANDASGTGNNGVLVGAPHLTTDRFGYTNAAYLFDGVSAYINYGNPLALNFSNAYTISAWIAPQTGGHTTQMIVCKEHEYWIGLSTSPDPRGTLWAAPASYKSAGSFVWNQFDSQIVIPKGIWTQVAMVYNGTTGALFVNGAPVASFAVGGPITNSSPSYSEADFRIGARQEPEGAAGYENFYGNIDDVRIYNRALSASEIQQLYVIESGPRVDFVKAFTVDYSNLTLGSNYVLQASGDLINWTNWGSPFTATSMYYTNTTYQRIDDWSKLFFRLQMAP